jgi:signal transduction histidine kinase
MAPLDKKTGSREALSASFSAEHLVAKEKSETGLGLSLSAWLARLLGGDIDAG